MKASILATRSSRESNSPRRSTLRVRIEKNASTWFNHEAGQLNTALVAKLAAYKG